MHTSKEKREEEHSAGEGKEWGRGELDFLCIYYIATLGLGL
jgi:hypothetical protein